MAREPEEKSLKELVERPQPESPLWWAEVDRKFSDLVRKYPWGDIRLYRIIIGSPELDPQNHTHFWNVVEKVGDNSRFLRKLLIGFILKQEPSIFTRYLLDKWWSDLDFGQKFLAVSKHGAVPKNTDEVPRSWLVFLEKRMFKETIVQFPELVPFMWESLKLSEKKKIVKTFPSLVYLLNDLEPCSRIRMLWYLAKRKKEFLPHLLVETRKSPCIKEREIILKAVKKRYPRLLKQLAYVLSTTNPMIPPIIAPGTPNSKPNGP